MNFTTFMQTLLTKKINYLFIYFLTFAQLANSQSNESLLFKADSALKIKNYALANKLYEKILKNTDTKSESLIHKLALCNHKISNNLGELYYLSCAFKNFPNEKLIEKSNKLASEIKVQGYELNDFNFILLLLKKYNIYIISFLLIISIYITIVLIMKVYKKEYISQQQKNLSLVLILTIGIMINANKLFKDVIVKKNNVILRSEPSAAANELLYINQSNKFNVWGGNDIWLRIFIKNKFWYIKESDVLYVQ
ncbi:MAG: hypothetical protein KA313_03185 [Pseudarcicella sp.]|nr:hypothetical protein [Pseudarcicella sp.]MBP6410080.1 hypothetical protein [Pseudarcicella sp.]